MSTNPCVAAARPTRAAALLFVLAALGCRSGANPGAAAPEAAGPAADAAPGPPPSRPAGQNADAGADGAAAARPDGTGQARDAQPTDERAEAGQEAGASTDRPLIADAGTTPGASASPCPPAGAPCRILPFGDSITEGYPTLNGGYRVALFKAALAAKRSITFVGSAANGPAMVDGAPFPRQHEGHGGYPIGARGMSGGLFPLVRNVLSVHKPHIVLLMIGTNDLGDLHLAPDTAAERLGALIDEITDAAPEVLVAVAQIIPTTSDARNALTQAYNAGISRLVKARTDQGKRLMVVDLYGAFTADSGFKTTLMSDDEHPKEVGYALIGGVWYQAIAPMLR